MSSPRCSKGLPAALLALLAACSSGPAVRSGAQAGGPGPHTAAAPVSAGGGADAAAVTSGAPAGAAAAAGGAEASGATPAGATAAAPAAPPAQAVADFQRAVASMRANDGAAAEVQFQQLAGAYPQYAGPEINLGILYRKRGDLTRSEQALRAAVLRRGDSATAWNELGVTLRLQGQFHPAVDAYQHAIAADADFAPAYRNLAVVLDLYLADAPAALAAMQRYQQLAGADQAVTGWVADLKRRAAKSAAPAGKAGE